jgi:transposase
MSNPLPISQREKIVNAYERGLGTVEYIANIFEVTPRSVFRYLKQYRETGDLSPEPLPGRTPILNEKNLMIIKEIVLSNIDWTLEQYRSKFYEETGIEVSIVTIHNACNILDLRRKKKASSRPSKNEKMLK